MINNCGDVGASPVRAVEQLSNECGKEEQFGGQELLISWLGDYFGCHWCSYMCGGSHAELLDDLGDILLLVESKNPLLSVSVDSTPKQPRGWSEVFNLEPLGECSLEVGEELSGFSY